MKRRINKLKFQINRLRLKRKVILLFLFILILAIYGINKMVSPISASPVHDETVSSANCKGTNVSQIICSLNGGTNKLYLLTAGIRDNQNIITVIGAGLNWLRAKSQCSANGANRTEVWYAFGSPSSGDVTITFDATVLSAVGAISRYSNADPTNPIENPAGSNRVGQESATCSGGSNSATATLDLTSTVGNTILFAGLDTGNQPLQTGDADYSLRFTGTVGSSNITTIYVHDREWLTAGTDTITHSLSGSTGWSMAGLVIRPAPLPTATPTATPLPTPTPTPIDLNQGLAGHWQMDEAAGTVINDSSGNGNTSSSFTGDVSWTTGKFGSALNFDGANDVVRIPETASIDMGGTTQSYSVSAWIKTSMNVAAGTHAFLLAKRASSGVYPYIVYLDQSEIACFETGDGTNYNVTCNSTALNNNTWHLITAVRDVSSDKIFIYVDGQPAGSATDTTVTSLANNDNVSIGNGGASYTEKDFGGIMDDVRIYNRALSSTEVQALFNYSPVIPTPTPTPTVTPIAFTPTPTAVPGGSPVHNETQVCKGTGVASIVCPTTGGIDQLYVVSVGSRTNVDVVSVTGLGLTFTQHKEQCAGGLSNRAEVWSAFGSPADGNVTITFASTTLSAVGAVSKYGNVDPVTPVENPAGSNRNGQEGACSGGTSNANVSLSLTSTRNNSILLTALDAGWRNITTADPDYTERAYDYIGGGEETTLYVHDRVLSTAGTDLAEHTLADTSDWAMAGLVIKPVPQATLSPTVTPTATPIPISTLTPTITPTPLPATPTPTPFIGDNIDPINSIYSYSGLGYYSLDPTFDGNRTPQKDVTIMLVSGSLEIKQNFSLSDPQDSVVFIVNGNIYIGGDVTRIPGLFISSQTFTIADGDQPIIIDGMVYARTINFNRKFYSLTQPTYQFIYQPKYIIDLLPYLGRPQVNWQEISR